MTNKISVSSVCPSCRGRDYTKAKAPEPGALTMDRRCNGCGTVYRPPMPVWILLALWAALLALPGYFMLTAENPGDVSGSLFLALGLSAPFLIGLLRRMVTVS